jgi:hypothetical protein
MTIGYLLFYIVKTLVSSLKSVELDGYKRKRKTDGLMLVKRCVVLS